jgi:histidyl-tRNA synthetase
LARNWEYYTGIVFELYTSDEIDLGGGGRYDELVSLIGGQESVPAVGFAFNVDHLLGLETLAPESDHGFIAVKSEDPKFSLATNLAQRLRADRIVTVLLGPGESAADHQHVLEVGQSGEIRFNTQTFTTAAYDELLNSIRQAINDS